MDNKNILISGAGIAGLTLAYWLKKYGFNPTIVEKSPKIRDGGYVIDFWGKGFDVAEKMGIISCLARMDIKYSEMTFVDENNKRLGGLDAFKLRKLLKNQVFILLRSDLSKTLYNHLEKDVKIIFDDSITHIEQKTEGVIVSFKSGKVLSFDLVIGADGLHSNVRSLIFGKEVQFEKFYSYYTASYTIKETSSNDKVFLTYNVPGKQVAIYSINANKWVTSFIFNSPQKLSFEYSDLEKQKQILKNEFENIGWKCKELLSKMDTAPDFYFDAVSQIQMDNWYKERVTLVGDACYCPSLLSGQGSTLAMVGAYILAGELKDAGGNYITAFQQYEKDFKPFITSKQKTAQSLANSFVPKTKFGIWLRNTFINLMFLPFLSKLFIDRFMRDKIKLKEY